VSQTFNDLLETRPRGDVGTSGDRLDTETSRPTLHSWFTHAHEAKLMSTYY